MALAKVKIDLQAGTSQIEVNGQDIGRHCRRLVVEASADRSRIPTVYLELNAEVEIVGEGVVNLEPPGGGSAAEFVASLEPEEIEARLLDRMGGLGAETTTGEAFVGLLREMADGY